MMYAPDQDRYLVAWRHYTSASQYDVYGQRLSGTGDFVGSAFAIATGPASTLQTPTDIVYNSQSNQFLVLWQDGRSGKLHVFGRHVSLTGSLGSETQITSVTSTNQKSGVGAYNAANDQYLVVWATSDSKILARRMTGGGVVTTTDTILLSSNPSITTFGNTTSFNATITAGTNVFYSWNFGDNTSGYGAAPNHTYAQPGTYTATITATNSDNLLTAATVVTIYQSAVADFVGTPVSGTVPLSVTFTNSSAFATSYLWQFGDGATSTAISPTHVYTQTGIYTVTLWAANPYSSDVLTRSAYITVLDNNPSVVIVKEGPAIVEAGEPITYTLTVTHNGQYNLCDIIQI